jgi:hypothetical protein
MNKVPIDFGALNGTEVSNKDTFFGELDEVLGRTPTVEYIPIFQLSSHQRGFKHGATVYERKVGNGRSAQRTMGNGYSREINGR